MSPSRCVVAAALMLVGCAAPQRSEHVDLDVASPAAPKSGGPDAPTRSADPFAFQASGCVRAGLSAGTRLDLTADGRVPYASLSSSSLDLRFAATRSRSGMVEAETFGLKLRGFAQLRSLPLTVPGAFEGFGILRSYEREGVIEEVTPRADGAFDVRLAQPPGLRMLDPRAVTLRATCDEITDISLIGPNLPPDVAGQYEAAFVRDGVAISKTTGGEPFAEIDASRVGGCDGTVVVTETRGESALVRVYLKNLIVYGWVAANAVRSNAATSPGAPLRDPCEFGMIGLLNAGGVEPTPQRYHCRGTLPLFVSVKGMEASVGQIGDSFCITRQSRDAAHDFITVESRAAVPLTLDSGARLFSKSADLGSCTLLERTDAISTCF